MTSTPRTPQVVGELSVPCGLLSLRCLLQRSSKHVHMCIAGAAMSSSAPTATSRWAAAVAVHAVSATRTSSVSCRPHSNASLRTCAVQDAYGATLYRSSACATTGTMVIKIIDSCPCIFPSNSYSNKRCDVPVQPLRRATEAFCQVQVACSLGPVQLHNAAVQVVLWRHDALRPVLLVRCLPCLHTR